MAWVLPEVTIQKVIGEGLRKLRANKPAFLDIFANYTHPELQADYGAQYREQIWEWFSTTKIPVIQSWTINPQRIPCISVHLGNEQEAEDKLALDDFAGVFGDDATTGTAVFTVMLDIGLHAHKSGEYVLWMYYILSYILFKSKPTLDRLGLRMGTFSASDYSKDADKIDHNIWTRWVRYRCTTQNFWDADDLVTIEDVVTDSQATVLTTDVATSQDVDMSTLDLTSSRGFRVGRIGTDEDDFES